MWRVLFRWLLCRKQFWTESYRVLFGSYWLMDLFLHVKFSTCTLILGWIGPGFKRSPIESYRVLLGGIAYSSGPVSLPQHILWCQRTWWFLFWMSGFLPVLWFFGWMGPGSKRSPIGSYWVALPILVAQWPCHNTSYDVDEDTKPWANHVTCSWRNGTKLSWQGWVGFASDSRMLAQVPPLRRVVFEATSFNGEKFWETEVETQMRRIDIHTGAIVNAITCRKHWQTILKTLAVGKW